MRDFAIVVACDKENGIGKNNALPWHAPQDLKQFKTITSQAHPNGKPNALIMGRRTWESLPVKFRPLPNRINVVLSRQSLDLPTGVVLCDGLKSALSQMGDVGYVFVIGGANVYAQAIQHPQLKKIYLTRIDATHECDAFFPQIPQQFVLANATVSEDVKIIFQIYQRISA